MPGKNTAGASLLQIYTGLVYEGPSIAGNIVRGLKKEWKRRGKHLKDLIGAAN